MCYNLGNKFEGTGGVDPFEGSFCLCTSFIQKISKLEFLEHRLLVLNKVKYCVDLTIAIFTIANIASGNDSNGSKPITVLSEKLYSAIVNIAIAEYTIAFSARALISKLQIARDEAIKKARSAVAEYHFWVNSAYCFQTTQGFKQAVFAIATFTTENNTVAKVAIAKFTVVIKSITESAIANFALHFVFNPQILFKCKRI